MTQTSQTKQKYMLGTTLTIIISIVLGLACTLIWNGLREEEADAILVLKMIGAGISTCLFTNALGFLIMSMIFKAKFLTIVSIITAAVGSVVLMVVLGAQWWIGLIVAIGLFLIILFAAMAIYRKPLAESMTFSNEDPNHETYAEFQAKTRVQKKPDPEIKSFDDKDQNN